MKKLLCSIAIALSVLTIACKNETTTPSIVGFWTGTYTSATISNFFSVSFNSDGTARAYSNNSDTTIADRASGTYSVGVDSVRMIFGSTSTRFSGKLNSNSNQMDGLFRSSTSSAVYGTFSISR